jgi:hypothetical protein
MRIKFGYVPVCVEMGLCVFAYCWVHVYRFWRGGGPDGEALRTLRKQF